MVLGGPIFWRLEEAPQVFRVLREYAPDASDELGITVGIAPVPPEQFGKPVAGLILVWAGDPAEGERAIAPLRQVGAPVADGIRPIPYVALQSMLDGGTPHGRHYYWKAHRLPALTDEVIDTFVTRIRSMTSPFAQINGWAVGGAVSRIDAGATAVGDREVGFEVSIVAAWQSSDPDGERQKAWVREGWEALQPYSSGVYANFISDEGTAGLQAAYGERLKLLTRLKDRYDPTNFFRMNANIQPSNGVAR